MSYEEVAIFLTGALCASVLTWVVAILMSNTEKPEVGTRFTGDQVAMLNRLLDENDVQLTSKDWRRPTDEEWEALGGYLASRTEEWDRRVVHQVVDEVTKFLDSLPTHPNTKNNNE